MRNEVLEVIKSRRVTRQMTDEPVEREKLESILEAGRWAPVGGNQRVHRFIAVQDPATLRTLRLVSPGMTQRPTAAIIICIDSAKVEDYRFTSTDRVPTIDLGTAMQTMMLAAHAIGLGSGPVTSFSKEAVRVVLNLPQNLSPEVILCIGYPNPVRSSPIRAPGRKKVTWQGITHWERFENA